MAIRRISDLPNYPILSGNQIDNLTQWLSDNDNGVSLGESLIEISEMSAVDGVNIHMYKSKNMTMLDLYNVMTDNILYKDTTFTGTKQFIDTDANFNVNVNNITLTADNTLKLKINTPSTGAFSLEVPNYVTSYITNDGQDDSDVNKFCLNASHLNLSSANNIWICNINKDGSGNTTNAINLRTANLNLSGTSVINLDSTNINLNATNNINLTSTNNTVISSGGDLTLDVSKTTNTLELKSKNIHFGDKEKNAAGTATPHLDLKENTNNFVLKTPECYIGFAKNSNFIVNDYNTILSDSKFKTSSDLPSDLQLGSKGNIDLIAPGVGIYISTPNKSTGEGFTIYESNNLTANPLVQLTSDKGITHFNFTTDISGTAMRARWADLAETYASDKMYEPGTLVQFGGSEEVTIATTEVNAVVSTKPAFLMNADISSENKLPLALIGRVPVRVIGSIKKFERIILSDIPGVACNRKFANQQAIGVALESSDDEGEKLILCSVKLQL
jgi:hypothetical protein